MIATIATITVAFLAALGIGSITAARISHRTAIAGHRQNWINGLRDDLSEFFQKLTRDGGLFYDDGNDLPSSQVEKRITQAQRDSMLVFYRIRLRLNMGESDHNSLVRQMETLITMGPQALHEKSVEEALELSQKILRDEWLVTKRLPVWPWSS